MIHPLRLVICFMTFFLFQVRSLKAKDFVIPSENPKGCVRALKTPCALTTGDHARLLRWTWSRWELDQGVVLEVKDESQWNLYKGALVLESQKPLQLHTPFGDIFLPASKAMVHVMENRVHVWALKGEGIRIKVKGDSEEHLLVPGFQNWYGGGGRKPLNSGIPSVIHLENYAQTRAPFFMEQEESLIQELIQVAETLKEATPQAALFHQNLWERETASIKGQVESQRLKKKQKTQFHQSLRRLFLKKIRYDY